MFHHEGFLAWLEALDKRHLLGKVHVLAGVFPLRSLRVARHMARQVPGVVIPEAVLKRLEEGEDAQRQEETGIQMAVETLRELRRTPGVRGDHIMAGQWASVVPRLLDEAGFPGVDPADGRAAMEGE